MKLLTAVVLALSLVSIAPQSQQVGGPPKPPAATQPDIRLPLPFKAGETLVYEVSFSKFIFSGKLGELTLLVSSPHQEDELLELRADAVSKGFFPALLGLKVRDVFTSQVSARDLGLLTSIRHVEENKVRREYRSTVNREKGVVTFTAIDRTKDKADPKTKDRVCPNWVQDVLSAIYFVRTQPLNQGEAVPIPITDLGETYNIEVVPGKREEIKVEAGTFRAIQVDAKIFNGRFTKRSGELIVWLSDDARRMPLLAKLKTSGYSATIELKRAK